MHDDGVMKRSLQIVGVLALVVWTGLGLFAWSVVGQRVRLVVEDGDAQSAGDALLADRVDALANDFDGLVAALGTNFGRVATAIESDAAERAAAQARADARLEALEAALPAALHARETAGALDAVLDRLEALQTAPGTAIEAEPTRAREPAAAPPNVPAPPAEAPDPAEATADAPDEAPRKKSFLAFELPSRDFRFEGEQTFEVLADLSRIGFDAKSTLHDFSGVTDRVRGSFRVDLSRAAEGISGAIGVEARSLRTGLEGRDEAMLEHLDAEAFPDVEFVPTGFEPTRCDPQARELAGWALGRLTVRGVTREVAMEVQARVDDARRLVVEGEMPLSLSDYGVPVPNKLGVISMQDEVRVWIHLRARVKAEGAQR